MMTELISQLEPLHADAFGWAMHCCGGDVSLAEDVLQSAYLKLAAERARYDGRSAVKTWWFGVVRLTSLEEQRRQRFRRSLLGKLLLGRSSHEESHPSPAEELQQAEQRGKLRAVLSQLPGRQAEVLHLVFYQSLTLAEAAGVMRVSLGTARQHYERGKAKLRQLISREEEGVCHEYV
jgi:RNA polymerase sigma-70 factor (ECF subfamily)